MNHECTLLSLMLKDENIWYLAGMEAEHFSDPTAITVFKAMDKALKDQGYLAADSVRAALREPEIFPRFTKEAEDTLPSTWPYHRGKVIDTWKKRQVSLYFSEIKDAFEAYDADADTEITVLIESLRLLATEHSQDASRDYRKSVSDVLLALSERSKSVGRFPGLETGLRVLDGLTGGLQKKRLYYVAARPSQGKSALLGQIADKLAREGTPVGYMSLESGYDEVVLRNWSRKYNIVQTRMTSGMISPREFVDLNAEMDNVGKIPIWINDTPNMEIGAIRRQAQVWKAKHDIQILFVDYVQLIRVRGAKDRREGVEEASRSLKELARLLEIPVVAAAQLRREVDQRIPGLGDFQHSSALEQDADVAMLIHWLAEFGDEIPVDMYVSKNRDGQKGVAKLMFNGSYLRFTDREGDYAN